jgi:hypothetical protein
MPLTVLVAGTWELSGSEDLDSLDALVKANQLERLPWWHPPSLFWREAVLRGVNVCPVPFIWSTEIDGVIGKNWAWYAAGHALLYFVHSEYPSETDVLLKPVNIIAHSHGGQVAIFAAAYGLLVDTLVTVGTPVRHDVKRYRKAARPNIKRWVHIYSPNDPMQIEGTLGDGGGLLEWPREISQADQNISEPTMEPGSHSKLLDPALWTSRRWWTIVGGRNET